MQEGLRTQRNDLGGKVRFGRRAEEKVGWFGPQITRGERLGGEYRTVGSESGVSVKLGPYSALCAMTSRRQGVNQPSLIGNQSHDSDDSALSGLSDSLMESR